MTKTEADLLARYAVQQILYHPVERYNVAPSQEIPVILMDKEGQRVLDSRRWGLVASWMKELPKVRPINAKSETIATNGMFKRPFMKHRCLIPSDGYFEWMKLAGKKQPYYFTLKDEDIFSYAGIYDYYELPNDEWLRTCALATTEANERAGKVHARMPVILDRKGEEEWLNPQADVPSLLELLHPVPSERMEIFPVGKLVGSAENDVADCINRVTAEGEFPNSL